MSTMNSCTGVLACRYIANCKESYAPHMLAVQWQSRQLKSDLYLSVRHAFYMHQ